MSDAPGGDSAPLGQVPAGAPAEPRHHEDTGKRSCAEAEIRPQSRWEPREKSGSQETLGLGAGQDSVIQEGPRSQVEAAKAALVEPLDPLPWAGPEPGRSWLGAWRHLRCQRGGGEVLGRRARLRTRSPRPGPPAPGTPRPGAGKVHHRPPWCVTHTRRAPCQPHVAATMGSWDGARLGGSANTCRGRRGRRRSLPGNQPAASLVGRVISGRSSAPLPSCLQPGRRDEAQGGRTAREAGGRGGGGRTMREAGGPSGQRGSPVPAGGRRARARGGRWAKGARVCGVRESFGRRQ